MPQEQKDFSLEKSPLEEAEAKPEMPEEQKIERVPSRKEPKKNIGEEEILESKEKLDKTKEQLKDISTEDLEILQSELTEIIAGTEADKLEESPAYKKVKSQIISALEEKCSNPVDVLKGAENIINKTSSNDIGTQAFLLSDWERDIANAHRSGSI